MRDTMRRTAGAAIAAAALLLGCTREQQCDAVLRLLEEGRKAREGLERQAAGPNSPGGSEVTAAEAEAIRRARDAETQARRNAEAAGCLNR